MSTTDLIYSAALNAAFAAGLFATRRSRAPAVGSGVARGLNIPAATLTVFTLIAIATFFQFRFPWMLDLLRRDSAMVELGEWWRIATALFVQDGGLAGSIFNLAALLFVGSIAEALWGSKRWLLIFFGGALLSELIALTWQPIGAGNSIGNFALAGSAAVWCIGKSRIILARILALICLLCALPLILGHDIHGAALSIGAIIGAILSRNPRQPTLRIIDLPE